MCVETSNSGVWVLGCIVRGGLDHGQCIKWVGWGLSYLRSLRKKVAFDMFLHVVSQQSHGEVITERSCTDGSVGPDHY